MTHFLNNFLFGLTSIAIQPSVDPWTTRMCLHLLLLPRYILQILHLNIFLDIQYDPLMMQQKEARRKHPCVLPKKVAFLV